MEGGREDIGCVHCPRRRQARQRSANSSPRDGRTYDNTNRRWHMEHKIDTSGRSVDTSVTKVSGRPLDAFHDRVPRQTDGIFSLVCARIALVSAQALFFFVLVLVVVVVVARLLSAVPSRPSLSPPRPSVCIRGLSR